MKLHIDFYFNNDTNRLSFALILFKRRLFKRTLSVSKYIAEQKNKPRKKSSSKFVGKFRNKSQEYIKKNYKQILEVLNIEYIFVESKLGVNDAALTAYLSGGLYGIYGGLLTLINNFIDLKNAELKVIPIYNRFEFDFKFKCILKVKMTKAIKEIFKFLFWNMKEAFKNGTRTTPYMQSYDHSYAKH